MMPQLYPLRIFHVGTDNDRARIVIVSDAIAESSCVDRATVLCIGFSRHPDSYKRLLDLRFKCFFEFAQMAFDNNIHSCHAINPYSKILQHDTQGYTGNYIRSPVPRQDLQET